MNKLSPGIISVLPLIYIGWSDSVLSPTEMTQIDNRIQLMDFLTNDDKKQLSVWVNPKNTPSEETFKGWINAMVEITSDMDLTARQDLATLGIELAKKTSGQKNNIDWDSAKVVSSIKNLEKALGVDNQSTKFSFYQKIDPKGTKVDIENSERFNAEKVQEILDGKYFTLKNFTKNLISDTVFDVPNDLVEKDELRLLIKKQCKALADQGLGAYGFPTELGGNNMPAATTAIFEALSMGNLSLLIKFGVQFGLFGGAVYQLGTAYHHQTYLEATGKMDLLGCFAMTETGHGSNVKDLETTATYNHDTKKLTINSPTYSAGKEYIGNAMHSTMAAVFVQLIVNGENHGIHAVLVPIRSNNNELLEGVTIKDCGYKMGLNGVDNGRIWFNNVEVPIKNLLNKYGGVNDAGLYESSIEKPSKRFFTMLGALVGGRVSVAMGANMGAKKALVIATKYALKRKQFPSVHETEETIILDYPTHQERLFPLIAKSYALTFALESLREKFEKGYGLPDQRDVESLAAGLKSYASWHATNTIQEAREACGGKGYLAENEIPGLKADTDIFTTFEGDNTVLMQLVAKAMLTEFKQEFHDGGYLAIARYVYKRVATKITENNPIVARNTNAEHILSHDFLESTFAYREQKLLFSVSDRMQNFMKMKVNANEIFLRVQTHLILLAKAHIENYIYCEFAKKIHETPDSKEKDALKLMLKTFALNAILEDKGWFLENDYISGEKSKSIRKVYYSLLKRIRPNADQFVNAFGFPKVLIKASIIEENIFASL